MQRPHQSKKTISLLEAWDLLLGTHTHKLKNKLTTKKTDSSPVNDIGIAKLLDDYNTLAKLYDELVAIERHLQQVLQAKNQKLKDLYFKLRLLNETNILHSTFTSFKQDINNRYIAIQTKLSENLNQKQGFPLSESTAGKLEIALPRLLKDKNFTKPSWLQDIYFIGKKPLIKLAEFPYFNKKPWLLSLRFGKKRHYNMARHWFGQAKLQFHLSRLQESSTTQISEELVAHYNAIKHHISKQTLILNNINQSFFIKRWLTGTFQKNLYHHINHYNQELNNAIFTHMDKIGCSFTAYNLTDDNALTKNSSYKFLRAVIPNFKWHNRFYSQVLHDDTVAKGISMEIFFQQLVQVPFFKQCFILLEQSEMTLEDFVKILDNFPFASNKELNLQQKVSAFLNTITLLENKNSSFATLDKAPLLKLKFLNASLDFLVRETAQDTEKINHNDKAPLLKLKFLNASLGFFVKETAEDTEKRYHCEYEWLKKAMPSPSSGLKVTLPEETKNAIDKKNDNLLIDTEIKKHFERDTDAATGSVKIRHLWIYITTIIEYIQNPENKIDPNKITSLLQSIFCQALNLLKDCQTKAEAEANQQNGNDRPLTLLTSLIDHRLSFFSTTANTQTQPASMRTPGAAGRAPLTPEASTSATGSSARASFAIT